MENKKEQEPRDLFEEWFKTRPESKLPELFSIISIEGKDLDVIFKETFEAGVQIGLEEFVKELETNKSQEAIQKKIQPYFQTLADKIFRDLYDKTMIEALARQDEKERIMKIVEHYTRIAGDRHEPTYQRFLEEMNKTFTP